MYKALIVWKELELTVSPRKKNAECVELGDEEISPGKMRREGAHYSRGDKCGYTKDLWKSCLEHDCGDCGG